MNPYFVGKDVTEILGYKNPIADHVDDDDKLNSKTLSSLGQRGGWIINMGFTVSSLLQSFRPRKDFKLQKNIVTENSFAKTTYENSRRKGAC